MTDIPDPGLDHLTAEQYDRLCRLSPEEQAFWQATARAMRPVVIEGHAVVVGPEDHLVISLALASDEDLSRYNAMIRESSPGLTGRVIVVEGGDLIVVKPSPEEDPRMVHETTHLCPPEGSNIMPCCGRTPLEVRSQRMTLETDLVTCPSMAKQL